MNLFRSIPFIVISSLPLVSFGQVAVRLQQTTVTKDSHAISLLASSLSAMGAGNVSSTAAQVQGTITYPDGSTATLDSKSIGFDRVRHDLTKNGRATTHVVNQGIGHTLTNGKTRQLPLWEAVRGQEHIPAFSRMADYQNPNLNVAYVGLEEVDGKQVHHIKLSGVTSDPKAADIDEVISTLNVFIDAQSLNVVKIQDFDFSPETPTNRSIVEIYFDDYRIVNGVAVPFHATRYVAGQKYSETTLQSVTLNAAVTAADFQ